MPVKDFFGVGKSKVGPQYLPFRADIKLIPSWLPEDSENFMAVEYSLETIKKLQDICSQGELSRPTRIDRYVPGCELSFRVTGVEPDWNANIRLVVEKFVGGGFAGQVYRVEILEVIAFGGSDLTECDLIPGEKYAMKILIPPSRMSEIFRNIIYGLGFQSPFSLQVNPTADRAAALWQKLIRRAAKYRFSDERAIADVHATFIDSTLGSCGEIIEWVEGRTWRFEVDDHLDLRRAWKKGKAVDETLLGSPEYLAKYKFMADLVKMLHEMGASELARQYEWWTCKSQPNCLKRSDCEDDPAAGLTAVDFKAGLALLPYLPMSPMDFVLIARGIRRGSLVQFDRSNLDKLQAYIDARPEQFADLAGAVEELKAAETEYRDSMIDVTHNHVKLLYSGPLWSRISESAVKSYEVRNLVDPYAAGLLRRNKFKLAIFMSLGLIPLLGRGIRKLWGRGDYQRHYKKILTSWSYCCRALRVHMAEKLIGWHRSGRVSATRTEKMLAAPWIYILNAPLGILPVFLHKMLTDWRYVVGLLDYVLVRPVRLYFNPAAREQWLRDMITEGKRKHLLTDEDADKILSRIDEPFVQKYLKSLAVHVCTLPVTQIVSVLVAFWYKSSQGLTFDQAWDKMLYIIAVFQVVPLSPGSLVRGFYVLYLVIKERNFKDYNIAVFLGFFKYVGYLSFPIQMAYRYPALARFMAAHWATGAVHIVPVFGEHGALLEHGVFDVFYNRPLTIRRQMRVRQELRKDLPVRQWHVLAVALAGIAAFGAVDFACQNYSDGIIPLGSIWYLAILLPLMCGWGAARWAGGASTARRIVLGALCGILVGVGSAAVRTYLLQAGVEATTQPVEYFAIAKGLGISAFKRAFFFGLAGVVGAIIEELSAPAQK